MFYNEEINQSIVSRLARESDEPKVFCIGPMTNLRDYSEVIVLPFINLEAQFELTLDELKEVGKTSVGVISNNPDMERYYHKLEIGKDDIREEK